MARPTKQGLDYFPLDVDFFNDYKIEFVSARFDEKGELITIKLLCQIYKNGYFLNWDEDKAIIFAKRAGNNISPALAKDVIGELVKRGFFDENIFNSFGILTSAGVQKRYLTAVKERKEVELIEEIWLIDVPTPTKNTNYTVNSLNNIVNQSKNSINLSINPQSKVKESKVKESKVKESKDIVNVAVDEQPQKTDYDKYLNLYKQNIKSLPIPIKLSDKRKKALKVLSSKLDDDSIEMVFKKAEESDFLSGRNGKWTSCDFEWLINYDNALKVLEGRYDIKGANTGTNTNNNKFVNYKQREYDADEMRRLERELLENDLKQWQHDDKDT